MVCQEQRGFAKLKLPQLEQQTVQGISYLTDDALASSVGVYMGFTLRSGGKSLPPYDSLNLATHVNDNPTAVEQNRQLLFEALGFPHVPVIVPNQVHGTALIDVQETAHEQWEAYQQLAKQGADGIIVNVKQHAALLCFADCLPVIVVSPTGRFAVLHAGWRGALAGIVGKAIQHMVAQDKASGATLDASPGASQGATLDASPGASQHTPQGAAGRAAVDASQYNLYLGPCIEDSCFEVSAEIAQQFSNAYGPQVLLDKRHVSLTRAVEADALRAGLSAQRVANAHLCTVCNPELLFSYRASGGVCGRHGAFGIRK